MQQLRTGVDQMDWQMPQLRTVEHVQGDTHSGRHGHSGRAAGGRIGAVGDGQGQEQAAFSP